MSYFPGVFITQYHKSRAGYYINHDLLMNGTPAFRQPPPTPAPNLSSTISHKTPLKNCIPKINSSTTRKGSTFTMQVHQNHQLHQFLDIRFLLWTFCTLARLDLQGTQSHCNQRCHPWICFLGVLSNSGQLYSLAHPRGPHA